MQKLLRKERLPRNKNDKSFKTLRNDIGIEELDLNDLEWNSNNKNDESNEWDLNYHSKHDINVGEKVQKGKHFNFYIYTNDRMIKLKFLSCISNLMFYRSILPCSVSISLGKMSATDPTTLRSRKNVPKDIRGNWGLY